MPGLNVQLTLDRDLQAFTLARLQGESAAVCSDGDPDRQRPGAGLRPHRSTPTCSCAAFRYRFQCLRETTTDRCRTRRCRAPIRPDRPTRWSPRSPRSRPASLIARRARLLPRSHGRRGASLPLLAARRPWKDEPGPGAVGKLRRLFLRAGAARGYRPDQRDGGKAGAMGQRYRNLPVSAMSSGLNPSREWKRARAARSGWSATRSTPRSARASCCQPLATGRDDGASGEQPPICRGWCIRSTASRCQRPRHRR
jgi:hypothetical protein